jgi:hypothetical protein
MSASVFGVSNIVTQSSAASSIVVNRQLGDYDPSGSGTWTAKSGPVYPSVGDELLLVVAGTFGGGNTSVPPGQLAQPPAGFTALFDNPVTNTGTGQVRGLWVFRRTATSADAAAGSYTIPYSGTTPAGARAVAFLVSVRPGAGESIQWDLSSGQQNNAAASRMNTPSVTGGHAADLVLRFLWQLSSSQTGTSRTHVKHDTPFNAASGGSALTPAGVTSVEGTSFGYNLSVGRNAQAADGSAQQRYLPLVKEDGSAVTGSNGVAVTAIAEAVAQTAASFTVAPSVSGSASVGATLTVSDGTIAGFPTPTVTARQWTRDGADISGATGSTYVAVSADAGHTIRCRVTADNGVGSPATATSSNGISIPAVPVNTTAPSIPAGTYHTGDTLTVTPGSYTPPPDTKTYQWYRGTSPLTGQTGTTYTLVVTDEGANITVHEVGHNGGGDSAEAVSNIIVPVVTAPISDASILTFLSGGVGNIDPALSIGGARGGTLPPDLNNLFGPILGTLAQAGGDLYRVVYVRNTHTINTLTGIKPFIEVPYDHPGMHLSYAIPAEGVNTAVPALASGTTAPSGVTWASNTDPAAGLDFGDLGPSQYRGLYLRLHIDPGTTTVSESDATVAYRGTAT